VLLDVPPELVALHVALAVPSLLTVVVTSQAADLVVIAESGSETAKVTVTSPVLYHPPDPLEEDGTTVGVITGGVASEGGASTCTAPCAGVGSAVSAVLPVCETVRVPD